MIDLHCHLLPGVDDGPDTLEEALALCRIAVADGITHAVVTPHIHPGRWANNKDSIARSCGALQATLDQEGIALRLGFSAEVRLTDQLMRQVEDEEIPFYGEVDEYRVMLLEFPHGHIIPGSDKLTQWLLARNIRPMIAHPERNRQIMHNPELLEPFLAMGCLIQVTAGAVTGDFGERAMAAARYLLECDQVTVLASDGHNARARPPQLSRAYQYVKEGFGKEAADSMTLHRPARITADQFGKRAPRLC